MKLWLPVGVGVLLVVGLLALFISRSTSPQSTQRLAAGTVIYDVRTAEEYAAGHVANATSLPLQSIQAGSLPAVEKEAPIAVYCRSGNRSAQAATLLQQAGYSNVTDLGGLDNLSRYGLVVQ